jgi:ribosomal protein S18 acetylase RimI-like enzyme
MVLLKRPPASPSWTPKNAVSLHGLKIAKDLQGRGLGRFALQLAIEMAKARWPDATKLVLTVDVENVAALTLYRRFGMSDSGPVFEGRVGLEHRLELSLPLKTQASVTS